MQCSVGLISMVFPSENFFVAWRSSPQAENCPSQSISISVPCQHLPVIKKLWSQLKWCTDTCSREPREQGKMLVEHDSMSAFSWQHNFIQVPVLSLHCVSDAEDSAVYGCSWSSLDSCRSWAGLIFDICSHCPCVTYLKLPGSLYFPEQQQQQFLLDSFLCYFSQGISSCQQRQNETEINPQCYQPPFS